jgi:hypothetical protein
MPLVFTAAELDSSEAKILYFTLPEVDAVNTPTAIAFGALGLMNMNRAPEEFFVTEITPTGDAPTVACAFTITLATAFGFTATKTSATVANAVVHTYAVYLHTRPFYG